MKILWLCNKMLPQIAQEIKTESSPMGGWLDGLSADLMKKDNIELVVVFPNKALNIEGSLRNLKYYGFDGTNNEEKFTRIFKMENPDIVHIFGTEFKHTLEMMNVCEKLKIVSNTVISIQGLTSVIAHHYYDGLPQKVIKGYTFRDVIKQDNIRQQKIKFLKRGIYEIAALEKCKNIIGRTDWDKACTEQINPKATYHFCNETLRDEFYKHSWDISNCEKHSIFLSQGSYPIKGFHYMLEAMPEILKRFPKAHIYVTGSNPLNLNIKQKIKQGSYSKYIGALIKKYNLQNNVTFLGSLNEVEMCDRFLKSHVFVSASAIENSPNSVGEAMILGLPVVASDVGGVSNMMTHKNDGFIYQHNAPYMIAHYVSEIFDNDTLAITFSKNSQKHAKITHNKERNLETTLNVYKEIAL